MLKEELEKSPIFFDELYECFLKHEESYNNTEMLTLISAFVENNYSRSAVLYHSLFKYKNRDNTNFSDHLWLLCQKIASIFYSGDLGEIRRTLGEIENLKNSNAESFKNISDEDRQIYDNVKMYSLVQMHDYEAALRHAASLPPDNISADILYCIALIYEQRGDYENAECAAVAALSIEQDAFKIQSLAHMKYVTRDYEGAYDLFKWVLPIIKKNISKGVQVEMIRSLQRLNKSSKKVIAELYEEAIDTLLMLGRFTEARDMLEEYDALPNSTKAGDLRIRIEYMERTAKAEKQSVTNEKEMKDELSRKENEIQEMIELQKNWYTKLLQCQIIDSNKTVTDDMWLEMDMDSKMDKVIKKISSVISASSNENYEIIKRKVNDRYPDLSKEAQNCFISAEQIVAVFMKNKYIDIAPAIVEYGRVYENSLWAYLLKTPAYSDKAVKVSQKQRMLGKAREIIANNDGPLYKYRDDVEKIQNIRNNSAHAYTSKSTELTSIRDMIWSKKKGLLDELLKK